MSRRAGMALGRFAMRRSPQRGRASAERSLLAFGRVGLLTRRTADMDCGYMLG
jgi:hypothetical protein